MCFFTLPIASCLFLVTCFLFFLRIFFSYISLRIALLCFQAVCRRRRLNLVNQCQCLSKFFSVAKIAELLQSPQRHSRVTLQNREMIVEKEMFLDVDGKQVGMEMIECLGYNLSRFIFYCCIFEFDDLHFVDLVSVNLVLC